MSKESNRYHDPCDAMDYDDYATLESQLFISKARKCAGLTQSELAERMGVDQSRISKMENGAYVRGLTIATLAKIADACDGVLAVEFRAKSAEQPKKRLEGAAT